MIRIKNFNDTLPNEVHFFHIALIANHSFARGIQSTVHANDKFIGEPSLALIKEMIKGLLELAEHSCTFNQICLHFWRHLLIELKFLDD